MIDTPPAIEPAPSAHPFVHLGRWLSLKFVIVALLGAVLFEGGLRVVEIRTGKFQNREGAVAVHPARLTSGANRFDAIAVGSSSVGAGILMADLESSGAVCDGYTAWVGGPSMEGIARYTLEEVLADQHPAELIVGVTMREFNGGSPTLPAPTGLDLEAIAGGSESLGARIATWSRDHLAMIRGRELLQDPLLFGLQMQGRDLVQIDDDGYNVELATRVLADESVQHRVQEESELAGYRLSDEQVSALAVLLDQVKQQGIRPIVVNMPLTDIFIGLAPNGRQDYDRYVAAVRNVASAASATFVDASTLSLDQATQFADVNHVDVTGAKEITALLAPHLDGCS